MDVTATQSGEPAARGASAGGPVRVLLADDHAILLQSLRLLLSSQGDVLVVGECADGREAVDKAVEIKPDIVLMDLNMPNLNGIEATAQIKKLTSEVRVVLLSSYGNETNVRDAVRAGASGFVIKRSDVDELLLALNTVRRGNMYFSSSLADSFGIDRIVYEARMPHVPAGRELLTARELEVLQLVAEGHTAREIASSLVISEKTVESHKTHIMSKLGVNSRLDLLWFALETGIITSNKPEDEAV